MVQKPWQNKGFGSFEDNLVKKYASKNGKKETKICDKISKSFKSCFLTDWRLKALLTQKV